MVSTPHRNVSIDTYDACVDFPIFDAKTRSLKKAFLGKAGGSIERNASNVVVIEALKNINLHLEEGTRIGLVGHNGAGKSTLLRLLSGIYEPTRGASQVRGRVAPVFDLGVGMDPEISGYENIIIRGLFLGQTRKQMKAKMDDIADFTELGEYLSMPLRTYSTGMRIRLALGVVTSIDPEILLLDEGIGAVDAEFMKKARVRLKELVARSGMLVFASHSNDFLAQLCDKALWLDHGEIRLEGGTEEVVRAYEGDKAGDHVKRILQEIHTKKNLLQESVTIEESITVLATNPPSSPEATSPLSASPPPPVGLAEKDVKHEDKVSISEAETQSCETQTHRAESHQAEDDETQRHQAQPQGAAQTLGTHTHGTQL